MKLKNVLILAFLTLTLIPIGVVSILLYKSGFDLSKESYTRNLIESINVQVDYISQTIENNMIADFRFANRKDLLLTESNVSPYSQKKNLLTAFQSYLGSSEDKITVCILLDESDVPIYTIGEKKALDTIISQLPKISELTKQTMMEFDLKQGSYSLGVITPVWDEEDVYKGSLVSIYDKAYIFKIISSYYKVADTSTYVCRENGDIISFRRLSNDRQNIGIEKALDELMFTSEGIIDVHSDDIPVSGYYKNIHNSPWYLVGFIDDALIYSFTNQFVSIYIIIIIGVLIADVILSLNFSKRVVEPINGLIKVMDDYQNSLNSNELQYHEKSGYYETQYLRSKFLGLMKTILLVQHNFEGIYQLYQSSDMGDTNIDIDVKSQTISSNKVVFQELMNELNLPEEACIVERFTNCFCEKDQIVLTEIFENMRDKHLSIACESELYTPYFNQKWFHTLVVPMYENDRLSRLFVQLRDISNFKKQEFETTERARRDALTGLYNRSGFISHVNKVLQSNNTDFHGLLFIDMDFFKLVNDNLGHSAGDDLLCSVGNILQNTVGSNDIVSRFGGDEFAIFLVNTSVDAIDKVKDVLNKLLVYPFHTNNTSFVVSASIGISTWSNALPDTLENLLQQADVSMYQSKREFKQHIIQ